YFTVSVSGMPSGTYQWRVKGPKYLANAGTLSLGQSSEAGTQGGSPGASTPDSTFATNAEMGLVRVGDCDNDNAVTATDFIILRNTFGKGLGDPGYDDRGDLNGDHVVTTGDFILLKANFGLSGAPPIAP